MQRDKNYEEKIEELVEKANKKAYEPDGMYTLGKQFSLDFDEINKLIKDDLYKGYDPKKGITKYASDEDVIKIFYRRSDV